jgi:hypothetical protein
MIINASEEAREQWIRSKICSRSCGKLKPGEQSNQIYATTDADITNEMVQIGNNHEITLYPSGDKSPYAEYFIEVYEKSTGYEFTYYIYRI